jgi:2-dehydropantoate 2-reductase
MQWVVYGAGAVGGVLGARLYDAGLEVVLVARGEHLRAIREHGLTLASPDGTSRHDVKAAAGASEIDWGRPSVVLLAVKSQQSQAALSDLSATAPPSVPLVCVQNGVGNELLALRFFADVQGVCVMMPTAHIDPGVVEAHCAPVPGILDTGAFPDGVDDTTHTVVQAFRGAGFESEPRPDIMAWKHRKLIMNLGNAVQACCESGPGSDELRARVQQEGERVLSSAGLPVVTADQDSARRGDILRRGGVTGRPRSGGSSWQSLHRATGSIESEYLNGEIVLLARLHGLSAPANELLRRTAVRMAREGAAPGSVDAQDLLDQLS